MKHTPLIRHIRQFAAATTLVCMTSIALAVPEAQFQSAFQQFVQASAGDSVAIEHAAEAFSGLLKNEPTNPVLLAYAVIGPLVHAALALALAAVLHFSVPDAAMLMVLSASASYIVVPAVLRHAIPEANPSLYLGLSLGVTFPLNILFGIPLYTAVASRLLS